MRKCIAIMAALVAAHAAGCARSHEREPGAIRPVPAGHDGGGQALDGGQRLDGGDASREWDAATTCVATAERCDGADQDCDSLIDEETDALCTFSHANGTCSSGECVLAACVEGFADCDGDPVNGCEAELGSDRRNCGTCNVVCDVSETCSAGVCEPEDIVDLAYARYGEFGCVIMSSGRLVCWGRNEYGAIIAGSTEDQLTPIEVDGINDVVGCAISIGMICATRADRHVYCRGGAEFGLAPTWREVVGLANVLEVRAGHHHFCALQEGGQVACWGKNLPQGALGLGPDGPVATWDPMTPLDLPSTSVISADHHNGCAVDEGGVVRCWGSLFMRSRESHRAVYELQPFEVDVERGAVWLSHSDKHGCFIDATHTLNCWGSDLHGGLGVGSSGWHATPVTPVPGAAQVVWVGDSLTSVLTPDGRVYWWGWMPDERGIFTDVTSARREPLFDGATHIAIGLATICAQVGDHSIRCMGRNEYGEVGDGTTTHRAGPVSVVGFE